MSPKPDYVRAQYEADSGAVATEAGAFTPYEIQLQQFLAPLVEGELLAAAQVRTGSFRLGLSRSNPITGGWLLPKIFNEERGMPLNAWLALTAKSIYVFRPQQVQTPLRRWRCASLRSMETKKFGSAVRVFLTLESGKQVILMVRADNTSKALRDRVRTACAAAMARAPALAP